MYCCCVRFIQVINSKSSASSAFLFTYSCENTLKSVPRIHILSHRLQTRLICAWTQICEKCLFPSDSNMMRKNTVISKTPKSHYAKVTASVVLWVSESQRLWCIVPHQCTHTNTCTRAHTHKHTLSRIIAHAHTHTHNPSPGLVAWMIIILLGILSLFTAIDLPVTTVQMNVWGMNWKQLSHTGHGCEFLPHVKQPLHSLYP